MRCRLFIDEVGNGDPNHTVAADPNQRHLSLSGLITRLDLYEKRFIPVISRIKRDIFCDEKIILHRREIVRRERAFYILRDAVKERAFNESMLSAYKQLPYIMTTVTLDKFEHVSAYGEFSRDPYEMCLREHIDRYIFWLRRHNYTGDIVIECRGPKPDRRIKEAFHEIYEKGTGLVKPGATQKYLTSREIKLANKSDNCPAMQVIDLLAHPSFRAMKFSKLGIELPNDFGSEVVKILQANKYSRNPITKQINGWGTVWLPK